MTWQNTALLGNFGVSIFFLGLMVVNEFCIHNNYLKKSIRYVCLLLALLFVSTSMQVEQLILEEYNQTLALGSDQSAKVARLMSMYDTNYIALFSLFLFFSLIILAWAIFEAISWLKESTRKRARSENGEEEEGEGMGDLN